MRTRPGKILGTLGYMPLEQIGGEGVGGRHRAVEGRGPDQSLERGHVDGVVEENLVEQVGHLIRPMDGQAEGLAFG